MRKRLKMKDLEQATGVGREAIRFYIREGLLPEPERPGRNVAWYDESFVERIALIKKLQQERFLPLTVIKGVLGGDVMPSAAQVRTLMDLDGKLLGTSGRGDERAAEKLSSLAKRLDLTAGEIRAIGNAGAIDVVTRDGDQWIEGSDVSVLELWARFRRAGFTDALGFGAEQIAMYVEFCGWLVREELRSFAGNITGRVDAETARRMAQDGISLAGEMLTLLHERTLLRAIARGNVPRSDEQGSDAVGD